MGGEMLYRARGRHRCETPAREALGSVWRCGECGTYWRMDALPLMAFAAWHPMGRLALWRWKRRNAAA
jgi:hypothetical protein